MKPERQSPARDHWKLAWQIEQLMDGTLSETDLADLNQRLLSDPAARTQAAELLHLHGEMKAAAPGLQRHILPRVPVPSKKKILPFVLSGSPWLVAAAACIALVLKTVSPAKNPTSTAAQPGPPVKPVAVLVEAKNCRWAESSLPTVSGSSIGPGFYEIVEGTAKIRFESGAEILLEAPSTLEITDALNCRLRKGALIADVPKSAVGFTVDTPNAKVVDFGTKFGVSTTADDYYVVQVHEGLVEVTDKNTKVTKALLKDEHVSVGGEKLADGNVSETLNPSRSTEISSDDGWQMLSTAYGNGADSFIQLGTYENSPSSLREFGHHPMLRVKHSENDVVTNRKAYVRFDLSALDIAKVADARFTLSIVRSDLGFSSLCPDATFSIYGLTDETEDNWIETSLTWQSAPAHIPGSTAYHVPAPSKSVKLGQFTIQQGRTSGTVSIAGANLVDFLKSDSNKLATLIICRDTDESYRGGYVHEFATKENRNVSGPTLKLLYEK